MALCEGNLITEYFKYRHPKRVTIRFMRRSTVLDTKLGRIERLWTTYLVVPLVANELDDVEYAGSIAVSPKSARCAPPC